MRRLSKKQLEIISRASLDKCRNIGLKHARKNLAYMENTVSKLIGTEPASDSAIVISAGPSLHRNNSILAIIKAKYKGAIISADGALYHCLRNGLVPDYVVTVDPHPTRMIRLFGDTNMCRKSEDDYFRRQDLDPAMNSDEVRRNREIIRMVNKFGKKIKLIISTSASPAIAKRCLEAGMSLYWWNPIYDDYNAPGSLTRKIYEFTKAPCLSTGGNVGACGWVFSKAILGIPHTALVGMDLSYHPDTPIFRTQYYHELRDIFGDDLEQGYIKVYNPYLKQTWYTDPAYYWYRESFLKMSRKALGKTYNCTEGGILFGRGILFTDLSDFLKKFK